MKLFSSLFLLFTLALLIGCTPQPTIQPTGTIDDVDGMGKGLSTLDTLDEELDTSDLEGVEDDLNVDF